MSLRAVLRASRTTPSRAACALPALSTRFFRTDLYGTDIWNKFRPDEGQARREAEYLDPLPEPVRVTVTGAAGNIGYALLFRIASGELLGPRQRVIIQALEMPGALEALKGVQMEIQDCAFPTVAGFIATDDPKLAFEGADIAMLVGAKPRGPGMERNDLLQQNAKIFQATGAVMAEAAKPTCKSVIVGNPANTNCLIAAHNARGKIPAENFTAMTRLDHDRLLHQVSVRTGVPTFDISNVCIWGNHSSTQFPDVSKGLAHGNSIKELVGVDDFASWWSNDLIPTVQQRGAAVISQRGSSSAASAANAALAHMRDWIRGSNGDQLSMAVPSAGYGVPEGLVFSYPVTCANQEYKVVPDLSPRTGIGAAAMDATIAELLQERDAVAEYLRGD